jgi:hypothetical protein
MVSGELCKKASAYGGDPTPLPLSTLSPLSTYQPINQSTRQLTPYFFLLTSYLLLPIPTHFLYQLYHPYQLVNPVNQLTRQPVNLPPTSYFLPPTSYPNPLPLSTLSPLSTCQPLTNQLVNPVNQLTRQPVNLPPTSYFLPPTSYPNPLPLSTLSPLSTCQPGQPVNL